MSIKKLLLSKPIVFILLIFTIVYSILLSIIIFDRIVVFLINRGVDFPSFIVLPLL